MSIINVFLPANELGSPGIGSAKSASRLKFLISPVRDVVEAISRAAVL